MTERAPRWRLVAGVVAVLVAINLAGNLLAERPGTAVANLVGALVLLVFARLVGITWQELGMVPAALGRGLRLGGAGVAVVALIMSLGLVIPPVREGLATSGADDANLWVEVLLRIPFGTALPEEVLFRGVLLAVLVRHVSTATAIASSSLVFGLWHVLPTLDPGSPYAGGVLEVAVSVAVTTVAGLVLCWLRVRSDSLLAPTMVHWGINSAGLLAAAIARGA